MLGLIQGDNPSRSFEVIQGNRRRGLSQFVGHTKPHRSQDVHDSGRHPGDPLDLALPGERPRCRHPRQAHLHGHGVEQGFRTSTGDVAPRAEEHDPFLVAWSHGRSLSG